MGKVLRYAVGLDIAKDKFDACLSAISESGLVTIKSSKASIANTPSGFKELVIWISKHLHKEDQLILCMEATGIYYEHLAWFLYQQGYSLSVLVPQKAKYYLRSLGIKSKDDQIDAKGLSVMAVQQSLKQWKPISDQIYELRQLTASTSNSSKHGQCCVTSTMCCFMDGWKIAL